MAQPVDRHAPKPVRVIGRYALYDEIASGGMATVYFGRLLGPVGFSRTVAIKCLHPQYAKDPQFVSMFLDEARLAARIQHPNVVPTLDVVALQGELFLVMDYVQGESLSRLTRKTVERGGRIPTRIAVTVMISVLYGLHAAHEARSEHGDPLGIVHRDVSPQNVLVGVDGVARVLDFGVAKAAGRVQTTHEGQLKGKVAYMAPEQLLGKPVDRRTDVYAAAVVLWESIVGRRLFEGDNPGMVMNRVIEGQIESPSRLAPGLSTDLDAVVRRGLARDQSARFSTAREMAVALEQVIVLASPREVGEWVEHTAGRTLGKRAEKLAEIESYSSTHHATFQQDSLPTLTDTSIPSDASTISGNAKSGGGMQETGLSLTTSGLMVMRRNSKALAVSVAVGALAALVVVAIVFAAKSTQRPLIAVAASPGAVISSAAWAPAPTPESSLPLPSVSSLPPVPSTAKPTPPPQRWWPTGTNGAPPSTAKTPGKMQCNPPYWVDGAGIRHPKPECL
jgi:eukaryotic-like serine/threonine-protein kinase